MMSVASISIWVVVLFAPLQNTGGSKLVIHKFQTQTECQASIPQLKRYYRLYGKKWHYECTRAVQKEIDA